MRLFPRPSLMIALLGFGLLLGMVDHSSAIKCYLCDSSKSACKTQHDCDGVGEGTTCNTKTFDDGAKSYGCGSIGKSKGCTKLTPMPNSTGETEICYCSGDLCNTSSGGHSSLHLSWSVGALLVTGSVAVVSRLGGI